MAKRDKALGDKNFFQMLQKTGGRKFLNQEEIKIMAKKEWHEILNEQKKEKILEVLAKAKK